MALPLTSSIPPSRRSPHYSPKRAVLLLHTSVSTSPNPPKSTASSLVPLRLLAMNALYAKPLFYSVCCSRARMKILSPRPPLPDPSCASLCVSSTQTTVCCRCKNSHPTEHPGSLVLVLGHQGRFAERPQSLRWPDSEGRLPLVLPLDRPYTP